MQVCKILEDLFMADIAKVQSIKHFEGTAGRNHSVQNAKPKKKSPANPYLHPILHWQATKPYSGDGGGHTAHPARPPHQTYTWGCAISI